MTNQYGQPDADAAGNQPTQQFWAGPDAPTANQPGQASPARPGRAAPASPGTRRRDCSNT